MTEPLEVKLTSHAYGGEVFGRLPDGRAVFVPFALPGERVRARLVEEKRGYARAELLEVLEASPQRIAPPCKHFGVCGGCHYQHLSYAAQLAAKEAILKEQLTRLGGLENPPVQPIVPSPQPWRYRNHVQFHQAPDGRLGYMAARTNEVIPIEECYLPEEALDQLWRQLEFEPLPGLERISLRAGTDGELLAVLESEDPQAPEVEVEQALSLVYIGPEQAQVLAGEDYVVIEAAGRAFQVSAGSFFQVNTAMAEAMVQHLLANLALTAESTGLDVYCGAGLFSAFLAERAGRVIGIESDPWACLDFETNLDEFANVELYEAPAEIALPALEVQPDVIVVDPPRAGLEKGVLDQILRLRPQTLVYISCDPATLARDARRLTAGGYLLEKITPFDLFPQTYHIESISFWKLK